MALITERTTDSFKTIKCEIQVKVFEGQSYSISRDLEHFNAKTKRNPQNYSQIPDL